jgi:hypothetical protein
MRDEVVTALFGRIKAGELDFKELVKLWAGICRMHGVGDPHSLVRWVVARSSSEARHWISEYCGVEVSLKRGSSWTYLRNAEGLHGRGFVGVGGVVMKPVVIVMKDGHEHFQFREICDEARPRGFRVMGAHDGRDYLAGD